MKEPGGRGVQDSLAAQPFTGAGQHQVELDGRMLVQRVEDTRRHEDEAASQAAELHQAIRPGDLAEGEPAAEARRDFAVLVAVLIQVRWGRSGGRVRAMPAMGPCSAWATSSDKCEIAG